MKSLQKLMSLSTETNISVRSGINLKNPHPFLCVRSTAALRKVGSLEIFAALGFVPGAVVSVANRRPNPLYDFTSFKSDHLELFCTSEQTIGQVLKTDR